VEILLIDDEPELREALADTIKAGGHSVTEIADGHEAIRLVGDRAFDVVLSDVRLPGIDGLTLLRTVRKDAPLTDFILMTAFADVGEAVAALKEGASDYLTKPFDVDELLARLRALLRRHVDRATELEVPGGRLLIESRCVVLTGGDEVTLSEREAELLTLLARRPRQVFDRSDLRELVFDEAGDDGVVDTYIHYLRRKLGRGVVRTVRGIGYQLGAP
jgi:two-component system response regulator QseB